MLAPLGDSALETLANVNSLALEQAPAFWAEQPRRGQLLTPRMMWRLGILGGAVGLIVMVLLVAVSLWRSRDRSPPADGTLPVAANDSNPAANPQVDNGTNGDGPTSTGNTTGGDPSSGAGLPANPASGPVSTAVPLGPDDAGYPLIGIWERLRAGQLDEVLELRADGTLWRSVVRFNGMSSPEPGRWSVTSDTAIEYVLSLEHPAFGEKATAKVRLVTNDHCEWTLPTSSDKRSYTRRGANIVAAGMLAPAVPGEPVKPTNKPSETATPGKPNDSANQPLPPPGERIVGIWDLTRPSRYKSSMISFLPDGTIGLLMGKAGASMHMAGTWRVEAENTDQEELTLKVSLLPSDAKAKTSEVTPGPAATGTEPKSVRDPGSEITVRFTDHDRLEIDFKFFKVDAGGDYFRRGTEPPVLTNASRNDDDESSTDEPGSSIERWRVDQAQILSHTFERQRAIDRKNKRPPQMLSHPGCSYLHVTLEYLRGDVAVDGKDLRLVDSTGRTVGFNCYQERVDKQPKQILVVFETLGDLDSNARLFVEDRRSLASVW
ncbi:MAG: hypothetical protein AB7O62_23600 [Pirellulales bacterium]